MIDPFSDTTLAANPDIHYTQHKFTPALIATNLDNSKLPRIQKEKQQFNHKITNKLIKSSTKLPNLKIQPLQPAQTDKKFIKNSAETTNGLVQKLKTRQKSQGDDFTSQIQRKLRMVLEDQDNTDNYIEASDSDEQFQNKVRKHRELIKKEKQKREIENEAGAEQNNSTNLLISPLEMKRESKNTSYQNLQKEATHKLKNKQEAMYEKRMKDYRDESIGNRFLIKKKQFALKEQQVFKSKQQLDQALPINNFQSSKGKPLESRLISKKVSSKLIHSLTKDEDLFENLHNILLDPARKSENEILKQRPKRTKQCLKQQLKIIEQKLAQQRKQDLDILSRLEMSHKRQSCRAEILPEQPNLTNVQKDEYQSWRKIDASNMWLQQKKTNFEEEIERVNKYFEKSERSIQKHIENQKRLAALSLLKRKNDQQSTKIKV